MKRILLAVLLTLVATFAMAQQPLNEVQIGGTAVLTGNGTSGAGAQRVVIASDNTAFQIKVLGNTGAVIDFAGQNASSPANSFLIGGQFNTSPTTISSGNASPLQLDSSGKLLVNCTGCSAGSTVQTVTGTTGGSTFSHRVSAGSDNATSIKGSAGQVYAVDVYNNAAYPVYAKLYNASASPTGCGASNLARVVGVQAGTHVAVTEPNGIVFGTGIGLCITKGIADADDTAVLASDAVVDLSYK